MKCESARAGEASGDFKMEECGLVLVVVELEGGVEGEEAVGGEDCELAESWFGFG